MNKLFKYLLPAFTLLFTAQACALTITIERFFKIGRHLDKYESNQFAIDPDNDTADTVRQKLAEKMGKNKKSIVLFQVNEALFHPLNYSLSFYQACMEDTLKENMTIYFYDMIINHQGVFVEYLKEKSQSSNWALNMREGEIASGILRQVLAQYSGMAKGKSASKAEQKNVESKVESKVAQITQKAVNNHNATSVTSNHKPQNGWIVVRRKKGNRKK